MASDRKLNIYSDNQLTIIDESPTVEVITIYEQGPQGPRGEKGDTIVLPTEIISGSGANNLLALYVSGGYITGSKNLSFDGSNLSISGSIYISTFSGSAVSLAGISQDNNLTNITIGSGLNLLDNTLNAVGSLTGTGSITQLAFWTASKAISGSQNLVYDYTNGRLGINNSNPQYALDVSGTIRATSFEGLFPGIISSSQQVKENLPLGTVSGSNQLTSSYDVRYELKGSNIVSSSIQVKNLLPTDVVSGSVQIKSFLPLGTVSGSIQLTSSYDLRYELKGSNIVSGSSQVKNLLPDGTVSSSAQIAADISGSFLVTSASFSSRIVGIENKTGSFATTGSNVFFGNQTINGSILAGTFTGSAALITGDVLVEGKVTAREFFTQYISSSIIYQSGSTKFGDTQDDTHQFTGSIYLSGSLINVSHIDFSTSSYSTNAPARITWNPDFGTLDLGVGGGNVNLSWGLEVAAYVVNGEVDTLVDGEVVYMSGSRGDKPKVYRASSVTELTSTKTFGVVTEHILPNQLGYVTTQGVVNGLNLGSFNSGDAVWLGTTPGTFTATKPQAPTHSVFVGIVQRANAGDGQLYVRVQNGYEIDELHNVRITNPLNGQLLTYNQAQQIWVNGDTLSGSYFVSGSIQATAFTGSSGLFNNLYITGSSNSALLVIDSPASQNIIYVSGSGNVGIGTNNPAYKLDVIGNGRFRGLGTTSATYGLQVHNSTGTNNGLVVRDDSRVGINTTSLTAELTVNGGVSATVLTASNTGGIFFPNSLFRIYKPGSYLGHEYSMDWSMRDGHVFTKNSTISIGMTSGNIRNLSSQGGINLDSAGNANYYPLFISYAIANTSNQTGNATGIYLRANESSLRGMSHNLIDLGNASGSIFNITNRGVAYISSSLGIGTNAPAALLHISGSSGSGLFEIDSDSVQNIMYVSGSGNVGINTNNLPFAKFEVQSLSADESYILYDEAASTGTGTNWSGTSFASGYTHTVGSTAALTATGLTVSNNTFYLVTYTITGRTAGTVDISIGGQSTGAVSTGASFFRKTSSTATLTVTPTTDFNGTVTVSVKQLLMFGTLSEEKLTTATGTGWSGTGYSTGYTHSTGFTTALTAQNLSLTDYSYYIVSWTVTNRTAGSFYISFGNHPQYSITTSGWNLFGAVNGNFTIVPTSDFNGTVSVSAKRINPNKSHISLKNASGSLLADLKINPYDPTNLAIGYEAGYNHGTGVNNTYIGFKAGKQIINANNNTIIGAGFDTTFQTDRTLGTGGSNLVLIGSNIPIPVGSRNVLIGNNMNAGGGNLGTSVIIGDYIGVGLSTGGSNVVIGAGAATNAGGGTLRLTVLGSEAPNLGDNTTNIGNPNATWANIYGNLTLGTVTAKTSTRAFFQGQGTTSATYGLQVHNSTGTNNGLVVRDDGRVGIGTSSPAQPLHVQGSIRGTADVEAGNSFYFYGHNLLMWPTTAIGDSGNAYTFADGPGTTYKQIKVSSIRVSAGSSATLAASFNSLGQAFISGSLGIGTNAPAALLHISGSSSSKLFELDSDSVQNIIYVSGSGNVGIGTNNPAYTLDVVGSGDFSGGLTVTGSFQLSGSLFQYSDNTDVDIGTEVVTSVPTSSYRSAFFDYVISSGSNARAGTVFSVWGGSTVEYTETSTNDIGSTTPVSLFVALNGANVELCATTTMDNWSVKSLARML